MRHFVKIVNRGTYTNAKKAQAYVERELAVPIEHDERGRLLAIQMLEAAELAILRSLIVRENRVENHDDGIPRRWVNRESGLRNGKRIPVLQLRPIREVGLGASVEHRADRLMRRQTRRPAPYDPRPAA